MYDATPQKKKGRKEPALAALGGQVEGSEIGCGKESETLLINSVEIRTADADDGDDDNVPYVQWLDTPGLFDSRGPLVEIVNVISIAKCVSFFNTLRIVVTVPEYALNDTGEGFTKVVEAMATLFGTGDFDVAKKSIQIWINRKKRKKEYEQGDSEDELDEHGVIEDMEKIRDARNSTSDADNKVRKFLKVLIDESKHRKVVQVLEWNREEANGQDRDRIVEARKRAAALRNETEDEGKPVYKAVFPVTDLLQGLTSMKPMSRPAEKVSLPLTDKAINEIERLVQQFLDTIQLRCTQKDYTSVLCCLDCLSSLCGQMDVGISLPDSSKEAKNKFDMAYNKALSFLVKHLEDTTGKHRIELLFKEIENHGMKCSPSDLNDISFAMRAAHAVHVLEPHLGHDKSSNLAMDACCKTLRERIRSVTTQWSQLMTDRFIKDVEAEGTKGMSDSQAAAQIFGQEVSRVLRGLRDMKTHFFLECRFEDGAEGGFADAARAVQEGLDSLGKTFSEVLETQRQKLKDKLGRAVEDAENAASQYLHTSVHAGRTTLVKHDDMEGTGNSRVSNPFDSVSETLLVVKFLDQGLAEMVHEIQGQYTALCEYTAEVLNKTAEQAKASIKQARGGSRLQDLSLEGKLLLPLWARSSRLHQDHCAGPGDEQLNECYEGPVKELVEWHKELVEDVLAIETSSGSEQFAKRLVDCRDRIELSIEVNKLASVEKIRSKHYPVSSSEKWSAMAASHDKLIKRISITLETFSHVVESRLKHHSTMLASSQPEAIEGYDYTEHKDDLAVLDGARWCDAILGEDIIDAKIVQVWKAFEGHMQTLAEGNSGALYKLRQRDYKSARTLIGQIRAMESLWCGDEGSSAEARDSNAVAQRVRELHDKVR